MKKVFKNLGLMLALIIAVVSIAACGNKIVTIDKDSVIIIASKDIMEITAETTLADYMDALQTKEKLTYKATEDATNGKFITTINDKTAGIKQAWFIYTSDTENSSSEWTIKYKEKKYGSATNGISKLKIKEGETYIFALKSF